MIRFYRLAKANIVLISIQYRRCSIHFHGEIERVPYKTRIIRTGCRQLDLTSKVGCRSGEWRSTDGSQRRVNLLIELFQLRVNTNKQVQNLNKIFHPYRHTVTWIKEDSVIYSLPIVAINLNVVH